jgi:hypothetical protein
VSERKDGVYWVYDGQDGWRIAKWNHLQQWWVLAWVSMDDPAYPCGTCGDGRFERIGPMIDPPES